MSELLGVGDDVVGDIAHYFGAAVEIAELVLVFREIFEELLGE